MITMEIKKLVDTKYGNKLAQIAFIKNVGLIPSAFLAWGFIGNINPETKKPVQVGDSVEVENIDGLEFEEVDLGDDKKCLRFKAKKPVEKPA